MSSNSTHRKRLARALAEKAGVSYATALQRVTDAAVRGVLPTRLDEAGMVSALRVLTTLLGSSTATTDGDWFEPSFLRLLRQAWQGRVTLEPVAGKAVFHVDSKPASDSAETGFILLVKDGYLTAPPLPSDLEWVRVDPSEAGEALLAQFGADMDKFHELTAAEARALVETYVPAAASVEGEPPVRRYSPLSPSYPWDECTEASNEDLLEVQAQFLHAGAVDWFWHKSPPELTNTGRKSVEGFNHRGELVLRNPEDFQPAAWLQLNYYGRNENRPEFLLHPDWTGITVLDERGDPDATYLLPADADATAGRGPEVDALRIDLRDGVVIRQASNKTDQKIYEFSATYEAVTGKQGLLYVTSPGDGADKYVFGSVVCLGRREAWGFMQDLIAQEAGRRGAVPAKDLPGVWRMAEAQPAERMMAGDGKRRRLPQCDLCQRVLVAGEPWWMVRAAGQGWANDTGVVCGLHRPDLLPPYLR